MTAIVSRPATGHRYRNSRAFLPRPVLLALAALLVALGGVAADRWANPAVAPSLDPRAIKPGYGPATYRAALAQADRKIAAARTSLGFGPDDWLRMEGLARALVARWRLSGNYADLAEADRLLDRGLAVAPDPAGPVLSRASLSVLVHRLGPAEQALARQARSVAPDSADIADALALAGDVALQRGQLDLAAKHFAEAERLARTPGSSLRGAILRAQRGDRAGGAQALEALIARPRQQPSVLAELMLQRANIAYWGGDWAEAGRWIGAAQRVFPGYWLADAYAAQQFALAGRTAEAVEAYRRVIHASGRPEAMDALAHMLRLQGDAVASREVAARARIEWAKRAASFPEAVAHHQAEHELAVGSAAEALRFAQADARQRPQAPNLVLLARALLSAGRPREALAALDRADAQSWVSAAQALARAEVEAALGNGAASDAARNRALAINPRIADPRSRLIWFGHD